VLLLDCPKKFDSDNVTVYVDSISQLFDISIGAAREVAALSILSIADTDDGRVGYADETLHEMLLHGLPPSPDDEEASMDRFVHALS
jgi:hypothetical protein